MGFQPQVSFKNEVRPEGAVGEALRETFVDK